MPSKFLKDKPRHLVVTAGLNLFGLVVFWAAVIPGSAVVWRTAAPQIRDFLLQLFIVFGTVAVFLTLVELWALKRYWQGYAWARAFFVIANALGMVGLAWPPYHRSLPRVIGDICGGLIGLYQLWWLTSAEASSYFDKENRLQREEAAEAARYS